MEPNASTANDVRRSSSGKDARRRTRGTHAAALWAACLAAGIGIGVLTDGGDGPLPGRDEPGPEEDRDRLSPPVDGETADLIDHVAGPAATPGVDEAAGAPAAAVADPFTALVDGTAPATGSTVPDAEDVVGGLPEGPARDILEDLLPDVTVPPPPGGLPGDTTSTTAAPTTTSTTAAPTTTTTAPPGGGGPAITPLPDVGGP